MNRDIFSILLGKVSDIIHVRMLNVTGQWEWLPVHTDAMRGFMQCKCVLTCIRNANPSREKQQLSPFLRKWHHLQDLHHPDNLYQLMPLFCEDISTLECIKAITEMPNSPFTFQDRVDHLPYRVKFGYKCPIRTNAAKFFYMKAGEVNTPIDRIEFDGVLLNEKHDAAGFIMMPRAGDTIYARAIQHGDIINASNVFRFLNSGELFNFTGVMENRWAPALKRKNRYCFLVSEGALTAGLDRTMADMGMAYGVTVLHRKGNNFEWARPSPMTWAKNPTLLMPLDTHLSTSGAVSPDLENLTDYSAEQRQRAEEKAASEALRRGRSTVSSSSDESND